MRYCFWFGFFFCEGPRFLSQIPCWLNISTEFKDTQLLSNLGYRIGFYGIYCFGAPTSVVLSSLHLISAIKPKQPGTLHVILSKQLLSLGHGDWKLWGSVLVKSSGHSAEAPGLTDFCLNLAFCLRSSCVTSHGCVKSRQCSKSESQRVFLPFS